MIPVSVVDNFFKDPDKVRRFALSLDYEPDTDGRWPGKRTQNLYAIDKEFANNVCFKVVSLFYDTTQSHLTWECDITFQAVSPMYGQGWIHSDVESLISCVVYLTPGANSSDGTSIYRLREDTLVYESRYNDTKIDAYSGRISLERAEEDRLKNNQQFVETVSVANRYNRLIAFSGSEFHGAGTFAGNGADDRLTLVAFFKKIGSAHSPIARANNLSYA